MAPPAATAPKARRLRTHAFAVATVASFVMLTRMIACTPEQAQTAVDVAQGIEHVAHVICTIAGLTDQQCVERVLAERRLASLRSLRGDAGDAGE